MHHGDCTSVAYGLLPWVQLLVEEMHPKSQSVQWKLVVTPRVAGKICSCEREHLYILLRLLAFKIFYQNPFYSFSKLLFVVDDKTDSQLSQLQNVSLPPLGGITFVFLKYHLSFTRFYSDILKQFDWKSQMTNTNGNFFMQEKVDWDLHPLT